MGPAILNPYASSLNTYNQLASEIFKYSAYIAILGADFSLQDPQFSAPLNTPDKYIKSGARVLLDIYYILLNIFAYYIRSRRRYSSRRRDFKIESKLPPKVRN